MDVVRRISAVLGGAALVVAGTVVPTAAEVEMMYDAAGDSTRGRHGDIRTVRVKHGPEQLRVEVGHGRHGRATDVYLVWIDTDATRPGPEFLAGSAYEVAPRASVRPARGWDREPGTDEVCRGQVRSRWWLNATPSRLKIFLPRACLGSPERVRVSVASEPDYPYRRVDWAPGVERFGPWVRTG